MTDGGELPLNVGRAVQRSGTLAVSEVDPAMWELFTTSPRVRKANVRLQTLEPVARPSPWRHPRRWFRWNPLQRRRITMLLRDCEIVTEDDGTVKLTPQVRLPDDFNWRFEE